MPTKWMRLLSGVWFHSDRMIAAAHGRRVPRANHAVDLLDPRRERILDFGRAGLNRLHAGDFLDDLDLWVFGYRCLDAFFAQDGIGVFDQFEHVEDVALAVP